MTDRAELAKPPMRDGYLKMMRAHVDEGGQLSHNNGCDLLAEVERLRATALSAEGGARQRQVLNWAETNFGSIARNRDERAARLVEEAIEIAQAENVPLEIVKKISDRVYSRQSGDVRQEIGGLAITLDALAENLGIDAQVEAQRELDRILSLPKDWWTRKHAEKVAAGTADLTPSPIPQAPGEEGLREILAQEYDRDEEPSHEAEMIRKGDFDFQDGVYMKIALAAMRRVASYSDDLILPTNADEAELMEKVGYEYLQQHAPERLRQPSADLVAAAKAEMECGWLIELGASEISRPRYWGGVHGWTYDNLKAVRFAREEDARSIAESMDDGFPNNYRVKEHGWG